MQKSQEDSSSAAANAAEFAQPHWRVRAQGFNDGAWYEDDAAVGTGGILMPQPTRLAVGQYYYRFACSRSPRDAQLGGAWWIDFEAFKTIETFAGKNGYGLSDAARLLLALPYDWTRVDILVKALLVKSLRAYTGFGKPAQSPASGPDKGTKWIPVQYKAARQLFVPGLYVRNRKPQLWEKAFQQPMTVSRFR